VSLRNRDGASAVPVPRRQPLQLPGARPPGRQTPSAYVYSEPGIRADGHDQLPPPAAPGKEDAHAARHHRYRRRRHGAGHPPLAGGRSAAAAGGPGTGLRTELVVAGPDGRPAAAGTCEHWAAEPGSLDLSWSAARRFDLTAHVAGPDIAGPLDQLLTRWREHLADEPGADDEDTAATVTWPSRDIGAVATLVRHGLAPLEVIAARTPGRGPTAPATAPGVRVRRPTRPT
jgi:hypothetical protein